MSAPSVATLGEMQAWAAGLMASRKPDFVIGDDYLRRWFVIPRNPWMNVYLHEILKSDDDRAFHDHPWQNTSFLISGRYFEITPEGSFLRSAGHVVTRSAEQMHRLEIVPGERAISLFVTGPKVREWGFDCPQGWVHWQDFTNEFDSSQIGRGCGEPFAPTPVTPIGRERARGTDTAAILASYRIGQISEAEMVDICRQRPGVEEALRASSITNPQRLAPVEAGGSAPPILASLTHEQRVQAAIEEFNARGETEEVYGRQVRIYARKPILATDCDYEIVTVSGVQGRRVR